MNNKESEFVPLAEKLSSPLPQKNVIIKGNKIRNIQKKCSGYVQRYDSIL